MTCAWTAGVAKVERVIPFGALVFAGDKNLPLRIDGIESNTGFFTQVSRVHCGEVFRLRPRNCRLQKALDLIGDGMRGRVVLVEDMNGAPAYQEPPGGVCLSDGRQRVRCLHRLRKRRYRHRASGYNGIRRSLASPAQSRRSSRGTGRPRRAVSRIPCRCGRPRKDRPRLRFQKRQDCSPGMGRKPPPSPPSR